MKKMVKCPLCGKKVAVSRKGNLLSHLQSTGVKCHGIGFKASQAANISKINDEVAKTRRKP